MMVGGMMRRMQSVAIKNLGVEIDTLWRKGLSQSGMHLQNKGARRERKSGDGRTGEDREDGWMRRIRIREQTTRETRQAEAKNNRYNPSIAESPLSTTTLLLLSKQERQHHQTTNVEELKQREHRSNEHDSCTRHK